MTRTAEKTPVDLQGLIAVALRRDKNNADTERWTFGYIPGQPGRHYLELSGRGQWARHVPSIDLEPALGARIKAEWKQNQYGRFVGAKTLAGIIKGLGEDITPHIKAARDRREAEAAEAALRALSVKLAEGLRAAIDGLVAYEAAVVGIQPDPELIERMRALMNEHTKDNATVAEAVAYTKSMFGGYTPRADD